MEAGPVAVSESGRGKAGWTITSALRLFLLWRTSDTFTTAATRAKVACRWQCTPQFVFLAQGACRVPLGSTFPREGQFGLWGLEEAWVLRVLQCPESE